MKNKLLYITFCILTLLLCKNTYGQRQDAVWCFGDSITMKFDTTVTVTKSSHVNSVECSASIADHQGNLLFYVGGYNQLSTYGKIWDRSNFVMLNGDSIAVDASSTNGAIIVPFPNDTSKYYVISQVTYSGSPLVGTSLVYSIVDMNLNFTLGGVTLKNQYITTDSITEKLAIIRHGNGKDWWLIFHELNGDTFFVSLIDSVGIHSPNQINIGTNYIFQTLPTYLESGATGELTASVNGNRLVAVGNGIIDLFDFDRCTGIISNFRNLLQGTQFANGNDFYGCSFSNSGEFLYVSDLDNFNGNSLFQFSLDSLNIIASKQIISSLPQSYFVFGQHQLGPNGKIYITRTKPGYPYNSYDSVNTYLSVINNPDSAGQSCEFTINSFYLGGARTYLGLPNMPNYNLGRLIGSPCDTITAINQTNLPKMFFQISPNPTNSFCEISLNQEEIKTVIIYTLTGAIIKQQKEKRIDLSDVAQGIYFIKVNCKNENVYYSKVVKE